MWTSILALTFNIVHAEMIPYIRHGYDNSCAPICDLSQTVTEIETAFSVSIKLRDLIQNNCTWTVHMTVTNNNCGSCVTLSQRYIMSNNWNADRFLSVHCNAGGGTGTETFWCY